MDDVTGADGSPITATRVWYLFAVPSSAHRPVVVPDGDPAEGADQITDLHIERVDEAALKRATLQEDLAAVLQTLVAVHDHVDLGVGASTPHVPGHHLHVVYDSYEQAKTLQ